MENNANERLNIPEKLKVGFNARTDTYSGKLAYVVYINKKGEIAKETSWRNWIQENMGIEDYDNVPTEGFVLNKKVGDYCYDWNHRKSYCRVYDPRGFEVEISFENLLYILQECTSSKGKGLEGEFVYAWDKKDLVLLPVSSADYQASMSLINKTEKIGVRDLRIGASYKAKDGENLIYIGKINYGEETDIDHYDTVRGKRFTFYDEESKNLFAYTSINNKLYYCNNESYMTLDEVQDIIDDINNLYTIRGNKGIKKIYCSKIKPDYSCCKETYKMLESFDEIENSYGLYLYRISDTDIRLLRPIFQPMIDGYTQDTYLAAFFKEKPLFKDIWDTINNSRYWWYKPTISTKVADEYLKKYGNNYDEDIRTVTAHLEDIKRNGTKVLIGFNTDGCISLDCEGYVYTDTSYNSERYKPLDNFDVTKIFGSIYNTPVYVEYEDGVIVKASYTLNLKKITKENLF